MPTKPLFSALVVFIMFSNIVVIESTEFNGSRIYLDITQLISDYKSTESDLKSAVESFFKCNISIENPGPVLIYYESDFHNGVWPVQKALNLTRRAMLDSKLLINIIDRIYASKYEDVRNLVKDRYSELLDTVAGHSSITIGLSLEVYNVKNDCNFNSNNTRRMVPNNTSIIQEIKRLFWVKGQILKIGYVVDFRHLNCSGHIKYQKDADYFIVDYTLKRNDNIFTESYGAFKDAMKNIKTGVLDSLHNFNKTVFHRIRLDTNLVVDDAANKYCLGNEYAQSHAKELVDTAARMLDKMESDYMARYQFILLQFCRQWLTEESDVIIILKYTSAITSSDVPSSQYITEDLVIPQIPKLPVDKLDETGMLSVGFLLEEIASSGYNTIMINGETWQKLVTKGIPYYKCFNETCRPQNVLYLNDMNNSFSGQARYRNGIEKWLSGGGMSLTGLVFSRYYKENRYFNWYQGVERLRTATKSKRGNSARVETGCTEWLDIFSNVLDKGTYDTICDALDLRRVTGCGSLNRTSNIIVWRGVLKLKSDDVTSFTENTMKKLDAVILGRQILQNRNGAKKRVFLRLKITYEGGNARITNPIYCTTWIAKVSRLYEILLTWAHIHDFPIILEPVGSLVAYDNPISWQRLQTTGTGQIHNLMELFPIFIRRNYSQSRVFANWTRGMYQCIEKSTDEKSVEVANFHNKYVGTTISLNIRSDTDLLSSRELKTILLFALMKFMTVEVILRNRAELQILYNTLTRKDFEENLKINNISERNIYLNMPTNLTSEDSGRALLLAFDLPAYGFNINIHYLASGEFGNEYETLLNHNKTSVGVVLESCTDNTMEMLTSNFLKNIDMRRLDYLICDTNLIPANNHDDTTMQDALNTHLYLKKLFQYFLPNLKEIHFRLHPILHGNPFDNQAKNLLSFLADLNNYANTYDVHYFLLPVLSPQSKPNEASFWWSKNYNDLGDIYSFEERQARFLSTPSRTPTLVKATENNMVLTSTESPTTENSPYFPPMTITTTTTYSSSMTSFPTTSTLSPEEVDGSTSKSPNQQKIQNATTAEGKLIENNWLSNNLYILMGVTTLTFFVMLLVTAKILKSRRYLTAKEVTDFLKGRRETLEEASAKRKRETNHSFNVFDGLVHQKDHEISKNSIKLNTKRTFNLDGNFSKIYKGKMPESEEQMLVEICNKRISKIYFMAMLSEVKMLCYLENHFNIVRFIGCYTREIRKGVLWIATEFCEGGSLEIYISKCKDNISLFDMVKFAKEIASGMDYLSSQDVIHGDLRTKHVYLTEPNKVCKVGKFGLSRKLLRYQELVKKGKYDLLPWRWMSVESLETLEFSTHSDVWSFGVTIWEIFTLGMTPNEEISVLKEAVVTKFIGQLKDGKRLACPSHATPKIYQIISQCWKLEPQCRPDFTTTAKFFSDQLSQVNIGK